MLPSAPLPGVGSKPSWGEPFGTGGIAGHPPAPLRCSDLEQPNGSSASEFAFRPEERLQVFDLGAVLGHLPGAWARPLRLARGDDRVGWGGDREHSLSQEMAVSFFFHLAHSVSWIIWSFCSLHGLRFSKEHVPVCLRQSSLDASGQF